MIIKPYWMIDDDSSSRESLLNNIPDIHWYVSTDLSQKQIIGGNQVQQINSLINGFSFRQATGSNRPILVTDQYGSFMRFQVQKFMNGQSSDMLPLGNDPYTYVIVGKNRASDAMAAYVETDSSTANESLFVRRLISGGNNLNTGWFSNNLIIGNVGITDFYVIISWYDGTTRSHYIDGQLAGSDTPGARNGQSATIPILGVNAAAVDTDLRDVMLIQRAINDNEISYISNVFLQSIGKI